MIFGTFLQLKIFSHFRQVNQVLELDETLIVNQFERTCVSLLLVDLQLLLNVSCHRFIENLFIRGVW